MAREEMCCKKERTFVNVDLPFVWSHYSFACTKTRGCLEMLACQPWR